MKPPLPDLLARSRDLVGVVDAQGRIEYVSPAVERMLGWAPDDVIGRFALNFIHPADVQPLSGAYAGASPLRPDVDSLLRVRARDRSWRWLDVRAGVRFDPLGSLIAIELSARDVTERVDADAELRRAAARLRTLASTATGGILMEDGSRRVTVVSQAFCSLFGITAHPDALVGTDAASALATVTAQLAEPDVRAGRDDAIVRAGHPVHGELFELRDGRMFARDYVPIGQDAVEGHLWIFRDISEAKRLEAELREARDLALDAVREKSEFLATMSHEIRTPLSGISGAAALLLDSALAPPDQELAAIVADAAEALSGLLGDVLDVSRIEAGEIVLEESDYDLNRLLTNVAGVLRPTLRGRPLTLAVALADSVPSSLRGDVARVRQIVLNLASNAVKYTGRGRIELRAQAAGDRLRITVADTGPGIAPDLLARLFEPWTRGHGREWAGTGLGLGIARRLARAMDGDVTAISTPGVGSAFTLELPLVAGATVPTGVVSRPSAPLEARVLVAEDNAPLRLLLARQLARLGVDVVLVDDGHAAVLAAREGGFDAVLLDLRMPTLGGLEAARRIRSEEAAACRSRVRILALTADTSPEDVTQCLAAGMDGHMSKPVSLEALQRALGATEGGTPATEREQDPVLDEQQLADLAVGLGGSDQIDELLGIFQADLPLQLRTLRAALEDGGAEPVRRAAHGLRSNASSFGAARLAAGARRLEGRARAGELGGASEELARITRLAQETDAALAARLRG